MKRLLQFGIAGLLLAGVVFAQSVPLSGSSSSLSTSSSVLTGDLRANGALYVDGGVTAQTFTSAQWDGGNAISIPDQARLDLGSGPLDYLWSDGSAVNVHNIAATNQVYGTRLSAGASGLIGNGTNFLLLNPGNSGGPGGANVCVGDGTGSTCDGVLSTGSALTASTGFLQFQNSGAAPTGTDCDADSEAGRFFLDTTNERLYVCNGASRGWDYVALTD